MQRYIKLGGCLLLMAGLSGCYYPVYYSPTPYSYPYATGQPPQNTDNNGYCREYHYSTTIDGHPQQVYGTACKQPDGTWRMVKDGQGM